MSLTYDVLLDHSTNFLIYLSGAPSFWFLLNTSYDYGCHLASRFQSGNDCGKVSDCVGGGGIGVGIGVDVGSGVGGGGGGGGGGSGGGGSVGDNGHVARSCDSESGRGGAVARALAVARAAAMTRTGARAVGRARAVAVAVAVMVAVTVMVKTAAVVAAAV